MSTSWIASQILGLSPVAQSPATVRTQFGNRVAGQPSPGSATAIVLTWLEGRRPRSWWVKRQILAATGLHPKAVDWALVFLRQTGRIEAICDDSRCSRYLRYRAVSIQPTDEARSAP